MDITEIVNLKIQTERQIAKLLEDLQNNTGVTITKAQAVFSQYATIGSPKPTPKVNVYLTMEIR